MLEITAETEKDLPVTVKASLGKLTSEKQSLFEEEYKKKKKSPITTVLLAVFLPGWSYIYRGKVGLAFAFWFTAGGIGIWWIIDMVTASKNTKEINEGISTNILRDMKIMDS